MHGCMKSHGLRGIRAFTEDEIQPVPDVFARRRFRMGFPGSAGLHMGRKRKMPQT